MSLNPNGHGPNNGMGGMNGVSGNVIVAGNNADYASMYGITNGMKACNINSSAMMDPGAPMRITRRLNISIKGSLSDFAQVILDTLQNSCSL